MKKAPPFSREAVRGIEIQDWQLSIVSVRER